MRLLYLALQCQVKEYQQMKRKELVSCFNIKTQQDWKRDKMQMLAVGKVRVAIEEKGYERSKIVEEGSIKCSLIKSQRFSWSWHSVSVIIQ